MPQIMPDSSLASSLTSGASRTSTSSARAVRRTLAQNILAGEDSCPPADDDGITGAVMNQSFPCIDEEPRTLTSSLERAQRQTLVDPTVLREMEEANPGLAAWLMTFKGFVAQMGLFVIFIGMDAGKSLFASKAMKGSAAISTSVVVMSSFCSIIIGIGLSGYCDGSEGLRMATNPRTVIRFSAIAAMFAVAQCFNTLSYTVLSAGTIKIFGQLRLLNTAVLSHIFLKRRYLGTQWSTLFVVVLGALVFMQGKDLNKDLFKVESDLAKLNKNRGVCGHEIEVLEGKINDCGDFGCIHNETSDLSKALPTCISEKSKDKPLEQGNMLLGLMYVGIYLFVSDVGSIISEKWLKEEEGTPFYVQKVAIELSGLPTSILMSVALPYFQMAVGVKKARYQKDMWWDGTITHLDPPRCDLSKPGCEEVPNSFFQGWQFAVFMSLFFNCVGSWLSGMVVKKMSSVMKLLGKVISLAVVYFLGDMLFLREDPGPHLAQTLSQFIVMISTYTFLNIKAPKKEKPPAPVTSEDRPAETELPSRA